MSSNRCKHGLLPASCATNAAQDLGRDPSVEAKERYDPAPSRARARNIGRWRLPSAALTGLFLWTPAVTMQPDKRAVPEHQVLHRDPAVVGMVEPDEQFWLDISVVQTPETLELFRAAVKPGLQLGDRAFRERLAEHDAFNFDPADIREPFTAPTLLLTGRQDASTGYADVVAIHESFPRATLAVLDRAGHAVAGEQGPLFRALVSEWLDRVDESMDSGLPARELASMLDSDS